MKPYAQLLPVLLVLAIGTAQAQFYLGPTSGSIIVPSGVLPLSGLHLGTYHLYGDFGVRGGVEVTPASTPQYIKGAVEGLYSIGEASRFYAGVGGGYSSIAEVGSPFVSAFVGADFDAASVISLFLEVKPHLYVGGGSGGSGLIRVRSGINFHIGTTVEELDVQDSCCLIP